MRKLDKALPQYVTLQGLKNAGTLKQWRKDYSQLKCYIYSKEWDSYWRNKGCGYTPRLEEAGIYTLNEAMEYSAHCGPEKGIVYQFLPESLTSL